MSDSTLVRVLLAAAVIVASHRDLVAQFTELLPPRRIPSSARATTLVAADVDRDGDLDVLGIGIGGAAMGVLFLSNDGLGVFAPSANSPLIQGQVSSMAAGDLDGDGDVDIVCNGYVNQFVLRNDGRGGFVVHNGITWLASGSTKIHLADVDGDADLDVLEDGIFRPRSSLYLNDGSATFSNADARLPAAGNVIAVFDADGDRDADALVTRNDDSLSVWINDGSGRYQDQPNRVPAGLNVSHAATGDIDRDGDLDVVTGDRVLVNNGAGSFTDETGARLPASLGGFPTLGDLDGDGDLDLAMSTNRSPLPQLLLGRNDGQGRFADVTATHVTPVFSGETSTPLLADLDADRDLDVIVAGGLLREYRNLGGLRLSHDEPPPLVESSVETLFASSMALGDVDGDLAADLVVGLPQVYAYAPTYAVMLRNTGGGRFVRATLPAPAGNTTRVRFADLDNDGDLDVLQACAQLPWHPGGGEDFVYRNAGGNMTLLALAGRLDSTHSLTAADIDGDGDRDVLAANTPFRADSGQNALYRNLGPGRGFVDATAALPVDTDATHEIVAGDLDGDGDVDLICANEGQDRLYLNGGTGTFTDATAGRLPVEQSPLVRTALLDDFDRDGDLDYLVANTGQSRIYLNNGAGVFTDATATHLAFTHDTRDAAALDADEDGDVDVLFSGTAPRPNALLLNDGRGRFTPAPASLFPTDAGARATAVGDIDGDQDPDFLFADFEWRAYANLARQLHAHKPLQAGRAFALDVYAHSGYATRTEFAVPFLGFGELLPPLVLPPWGALRLSPSPVLTLAPIALLPPAGRATAMLPIPSGGSFDRVPVHFQALVLHAWPPPSWRWSNLVQLQR